MRRLATAAVLVPLILGAIFGLPNTAFAWALVVVCTACAWEYSEVNRLSERSWVYALIIALLLPLMLGLFGFGVSGTALGGAALAVAAAWLFIGRQPVDRQATVIAMAAVGVVYFVIAVAAVVRLHAADPWTLLLLVAVVALGDSAAFYVGRALGKRKLAPSISPNKTWEGAIASLLTAALVALAWALWRQQDPGVWLLIGAATSIAAQVGDLLQSAFKRQAGVKDSSDLLPGHGGVWDRTDAILLAAPAYAGLVARFGVL